MQGEEWIGSSWSIIIRMVAATATAARRSALLASSRRGRENCRGWIGQWCPSILVGVGEMMIVAVIGSVVVVHCQGLVGHC